MRKDPRDVGTLTLLLAAGVFFGWRLVATLTKTPRPAAPSATAAGNAEPEVPAATSRNVAHDPEDGSLPTDPSSAPRREPGSRAEGRSVRASSAPPFESPAPSSPRPDHPLAAPLSEAAIAHLTEPGPEATAASPTLVPTGAIPGDSSVRMSPAGGPSKAPVAPAVTVDHGAPEPPASSSKPDAPALPDDPESDRHPPYLVGVSFEPAVVADGATLAIGLEVRDDRSGARQVYGSLASPSGRAQIGFGAIRQPETEVFVATVTIPKGAEGGSWYLALLGLTDAVGNNQTSQWTAATSPPSQRVEVKSAEGDDQSPTLRSVRVGRASIPAGESAAVVVACDDAGSGVRWVSGSFRSPGKWAVVGFGCQKSTVPGVFEGTVTPPAGGECGEWSLYQVQLTDAAGNTVSFGESHEAVAGVGFTFTGGATCDGTPPVLDSVSLSPPVVSNSTGGDVTILAEVHDDVTGVRTVSGRLDGPALPGLAPPRMFFDCRRTGNSGPFTGSVRIEANAPAGVWSVSWIQVEDAAGNLRGYNASTDLLLAGAKLVVE